MTELIADSDRKETGKTIVNFQAIPSNEGKTRHKCPFGNKSISFSLRPGSCVRIAGNSGAGKTTLVTFLAGLSSSSQLAKLGIQVPQCEWDPSIPKGERCGVLFQQTTLLDSLTIAGNVAAALQFCPSRQKGDHSPHELHANIKRLLDAVGLDYARDANKRPTELSGGMARRASLALQLAQNKRVIILDEPFTGLDRDSAVSVAKELVHLRVTHGTALIIISHEPDLAALVMDPKLTKDNHVVTLQPPIHSYENDNAFHKQFTKASLFGTTLFQRFRDDLKDFVIYSLPLIISAFLACGMAIAMVSTDILHKIDVKDQVSSIVQTEVKPLIKMLTGEEAGTLTMMMVKMKVNGMLDTALPQAKAKIYAIGMAKLFVLEIGPLLTGLLLCGRIGGSYAGKVATMESTAQNKLLTTLGINPQFWTLLPALCAAIISSPLLTIVGTMLAISIGGFVGHTSQICDLNEFREEFLETVFPTLKLPFLQDADLEKHTIFQLLSSIDLHSAFGESYTDAMVEILTYPPIFLFAKSIVFILLILGVSEASARLRSNVTPRKVPSIITSSVVIASLFCILADWAFSRLLLLRQ